MILPAAGEIHLWYIALDAGAWDGLSEDERARAARFVTEDLCARWCRSRCGLRRLLGRYLGAPAASLGFVYEDGKPALAGASPGRPALHFNLSHSGDLALVAVTVGAAVGVDAERVDRIDDADALAAQVMTAEELDVHARLPTAERAAWFFDIWTRKEALAKAIGIGLGLPFNAIDAGSGQAHALVPWADTDWDVRPLAPAGGYAGAVALAGRIAAVRMMGAVGSG